MGRSCVLREVESTEGPGDARTHARPEDTCYVQVGHLRVFASALCAVHCGASGILVGATALLDNPWLERGLVTSATVIALLALRAGYRRHCRVTPLFWASGAFSFIALARLVDWHDARLELGLSIAGASCLVTAHLLNLRLFHDHSC